MNLQNPQIKQTTVSRMNSILLLGILLLFLLLVLRILLLCVFMHHSWDCGMCWMHIPSACGDDDCRNSPSSSSCRCCCGGRGDTMTELSRDHRWFPGLGWSPTARDSRWWWSCFDLELSTGLISEIHFHGHFPCVLTCSVQDLFLLSTFEQLIPFRELWHERQIETNNGRKGKERTAKEIKKGKRKEK